MLGSKKTSTDEEEVKAEGKNKYLAKFSQLKAFISKENPDTIKQHVENIGDSFNSFITKTVIEATEGKHEDDEGDADDFD